MKRNRIAAELVGMARELMATAVPDRSVREGMEAAGISSRNIKKIDDIAKSYYEIVSLLYGRPQVKPWVSRKTGNIIGYRIGKDAYAGWVKGVGLHADYQNYFGHYHEYAYHTARGRRMRKPSGYDEWAADNPDKVERLRR